MLRLLKILVLAFACTAAATAADDAAAVLARAKAAAGGSHWDSVAVVHLQGTIDATGLKGQFAQWQRTRDGAYVSRFTLGPTSGAEGYDGTAVWSQDGSGEVTRAGSRGAHDEAVMQAYLAALAYWYPQRVPAAVHAAGVRHADGHSFDVVAVNPRGAQAFELWFDAETHLLARAVGHRGQDTVTDYYADYHTVDGLKIAFTQRSSMGDSRYDTVLHVEQATIDPDLARVSFAVPASHADDAVILGGADSTTLPFELLNDHIYVHAKVNGKPVRLMVDTGGANLLLPGAAKALGIESAGALPGRGVGEKTQDVALAKVQSVELGKARIANQVFFIFPLQAMKAVEDVDFQGLVGFEVFKRFVVKIDYAAGKLTLIRPAAFHYRGKGTVVPFRFDEHTPSVSGSIDGIAGRFTIDTGSRSSVTLMTPFVDAHGLRTRYAHTPVLVSGWGVGGAARGEVARAGELTLGGVKIVAPLIELSVQKKGAFANPDLAGNVGSDLLRRFTVIFDYRNQQMIFEPVSGLPAQHYDRSGLWLNRAGADLEVMDVVPGSAAAKAGVKLGDRVTAIDGMPASDSSLPALRERWRTAAAGTQVRLGLRRGEKTFDVTLNLHPQIPAHH